MSEVKTVVSDVKPSVKTITKEEAYEIMAEPVPTTERNKAYVEDEDVSEEVVEVVESKKEEENKVSDRVEPVVEVKEEVKEDWFDKAERELAKPDGQEDLKDFSSREKAYFHQMKRDRKLRQEADAQKDAALFREIQLKKKIDELSKKEEVIEDNLDDILKDRDPEDLLTVADLKKIDELKKLKSKRKELESQVKDVKEVKKEEIDIDKLGPVIDVSNPIVKKHLDLCEKEAKSSYSDYEEVMELAQDIIAVNPAYQKRIAESYHNGENPAIAIYDLIKKDAEFDRLFPVAQTRVKARKGINGNRTDKVDLVDADKAKKAKEAQEALEKNKDRVRTSAHAGGSENKNIGEITLEEISRMGDREFAKLPKKKRDEYLRLFG